MPSRFPILFTACSALALASARALSPEQTEFFEKSVRPVLAEHCYKCHGPEKQKAALRLDSRDALMKGTDDVPIVVLGKPDESSFIKSIRHQGDSKMPEKEDKLPEAQITALSEWVKMGVPWPENDKPAANVRETARQTIATGFLMVGPKALAETDKETSSLGRARKNSANAPSHGPAILQYQMQNQIQNNANSNVTQFGQNAKLPPKLEPGVAGAPARRAAPLTNGNPT